MQRMTVLFAALFLAGGRASGQAVIEGDVYLVAKSGDVRPGAATTVFLTPRGDRVRRAWAALCRSQKLAYDERNARHDSAMAAAGSSQEKLNLLNRSVEILLAAAEANATERVSALSDLATASASTSIRGHFRLSVAPGSYLIVASMPLGEKVHHWLMRMNLTGVQRRTLDLNNQNAGVSHCDDPLP